MDVPVQLKFSELISNNKQIELSDNEYVKLLKPIPSPSLFIQVKIALSKHLLNKDVFMKLCIHACSDERHLALMGLVLRNGMDPNIYYKTTENRIHVIPYIYMVLYNRNSEICSKVSRLFIASGSDINRNAVDPVFQDNSVSVKDWLGKKYPSDQISINFSSDEKKLCSVFLDRPDLFVATGENLKGETDQFLISKAITCHADTIFSENVPANLHETYPDYHTFLGTYDFLADLSVKYLNIKCLRYFLEKKYIPSYVLINNVIVYLKYYRQKNYSHGFSVMKEILDMLFEFGSKIDSFQAEMIKSIGITDPGPKHINSGGNRGDHEKNLKELLKCTNRQSIDDMKSHTDNKDLNLLKIHTEINADISRTINRINLDADLNTNAFVSKSIELDGGESDECIHRCLDIFINSDENENQWYISSGVFDSLRESGVNPYTGKKMSGDEMSVLSQKRSTIKRFGLPTSLRSSDVEDLIMDKQQKNSVIDNNTHQIVIAFGKLCKLNNIREDQIDTIPVKYLQRILDELSDRYRMPSSELKYLSQIHAIVTFKRICMAAIRFFSQDSSNIFGYIKLAISRKKR